MWNWQALALLFWLEQLSFSACSLYCFVEKNVEKKNQSSFQDVCKASRGEQRAGLEIRELGVTTWGASGRSPHCRILLRSCRDVELLLMVALLAEGRSWGPASWRRPKHLAQSCHSPVHCLRLSFPMGRIWRDIREQHSALPLQVADGVSLDFHSASLLAPVLLLAVPATTVLLALGTQDFRCTRHPRGSSAPTPLMLGLLCSDVYTGGASSSS